LRKEVGRSDYGFGVGRGLSPTWWAICAASVATATAITSIVSVVASVTAAAPSSVIASASFNPKDVAFPIAKAVGLAVKADFPAAEVSNTQ